MTATPVDWGGDFTSLAEPRGYNPMAEVSRRLALASAEQIDQAVLAALQRRGLSLADAIPRLTRQVHGPRCTVMLDGQPLVEFDPPNIRRSAGGRHVSVTINSRTPACFRCVTPRKCAIYGCCPGTWPAEPSCDPAGSPRATRPD